MQTQPQILGFSAGLYDPDSVESDVRRIKRAYHDLGYMDCRIDAQRELSADRSAVEIRFVIDEQKPLQLRAIVIEGNDSIPTETLQAATKLQPGNLPGERALREGEAAITAHYRGQGYLFAKVNYRLDVLEHEEGSPVEVVYEVEENQHGWLWMRFGKVRIEGNQSIRADDLLAGTKLVADELFDQKTFIADLATLRARYRDAGTANVAITPRVEGEPRLEPSERATLVFDLTLVVEEGLTPVASKTGENAGPVRPDTPRPAADIPPDARLIERIVFEGVAAFDPSDIRWELEHDFDVVLASHPGKDLFDYLKVLQKTVLLGYRHNGFPDAAVDCLFNHTQERIEVRVKEGARFQCGEVLVTGASCVSADAIVRALTDDSKPQHTLWKPEAPAPFDDETRDEFRKRIRAAYGAVGCFEPEFDIEIRKGTEGHRALAVTIRDEGPLTIVGEVQVTGTKRDSAAEIIQRLAIEPDTPFGTDLTGKLAARLKETRRYLSVSVKRGESAAASEGRLVQGVLVHVVEYDKAPPLAAEFSPVEQAVIKLGQWVERWSRGEIEEDFVLTAAVDRPMLDLMTFRSDDGPPRPELRVAMQMVIRPDRGWVLTGGATGAAGKSLLDLAFVVDGSRIILADLERHTKVEVHDCFRSQVVLQMTGEADPKAKDEKQPFRFMIGAGVRANRKPKNSALFKVNAEFSAAFLLSMLHAEGAQSKIDDGVCEIRTPGFEVRIEAATGRLIESRWGEADGASMSSLRPERGALEKELKRLEAPLAAAEVAYDPASPWKSFGAFVLDKSAQFFERTGEAETARSLAALHKFLRGCAVPNLLQIFDFSSDENATSIDSARNENEFWRPIHRHGFTYDEIFIPGSRSRKDLAALMQIGWRRLVPAGSWLAPLGRDAIQSWVASDPVPGQGLRSAVDAPETGPAGELLLSWLPSILAVDLEGKAGRAGLERLSAADFANDYEPLLSADSPLGRLFLSLAESLRQLDEPELRALLRLLPPSAPQERIAQALLQLKTRPQTPLLPAVLDRLWIDVLRDSFEAAFSRPTGPEPPRIGPVKDVRFARPGDVLR